MKNSKISKIIYPTIQLINIVAMVIGIFIIVSEIGEELRIQFFRKYNIGWGYGLVIVYNLGTIAISLLSLTILKNEYFKRIAISCLIVMVLFGFGHFLLKYL